MEKFKQKLKKTKQNCTMFFNDKIVPIHYATKAYLDHSDKKK